MNTPRGTWTTREGRKYKIKEMSLGHISSAIAMLAREQLTQFVPKRQEYIEELQAELDRRKFKRIVKDLF